MNRHLFPFVPSAVLFLLSLTAAGAAAGETRLEPIWTLKGLSAPESVAVSADGSFLYVSNVNGEADAADGNGFISRVSVDGKMLEEKWAMGLDGPKGLVLKGARLFVTDITRVVELDAATGKRVAAHDVPGAKFLNDAALAPQFQQFMQRRRQLEVRAATLRGDFECSQGIALRDFQAVVTPVAQSVMTARGASAIVDAASTFYVAPENDITTAVIQQLDQNPATRVANVTRHPVAECLPQQPAAQQNGAPLAERPVVDSRVGESVRRIELTESTLPGCRRGRTRTARRSRRCPGRSRWRRRCLGSRWRCRRRPCRSSRPRPGAANPGRGSGTT